MAQVKEDKTSITVRLRRDDIQDLNELLANLEGEGVDPKTDREIFTEVIKAGLSRKKPVEVSKKEDQERIKQLEEQNQELQNKLEEQNQAQKSYEEKNQELQTELENLRAGRENTQAEKQKLSEAYKELKNALSEKETEVSELKTEKERIENENNDLKSKIIVSPNMFERQLIHNVLQSKTVQKINDARPKVKNFLTYIDPEAAENEQAAALLLNALKIHAINNKMSMPYSAKKFWNNYLSYLNYLKKHEIIE